MSKVFDFVSIFRARNTVCFGYSCINWWMVSRYFITANGYYCEGNVKQVAQRENFTWNIRFELKEDNVCFWRNFWTKKKTTRKISFVKYSGSLVSISIHIDSKIHIVENSTTCTVRFVGSQNKKRQTWLNAHGHFRSAN